MSKQTKQTSSLWEQGTEWTNWSATQQHNFILFHAVYMWRTLPPVSFKQPQPVSSPTPWRLTLSRSELLILPGAAQVCCGQVPLPSTLNGLQILEAHQRQRDLRVPRSAVLRTPKVNLLPRRHHYGEVHQPPLVLHAVHRDHALKAELLGFGAPRRARSIPTTNATAFTVVQAQSFLCEHAALLLPQLEETAAALLQQPVPHHFARQRHGHAQPKSSYSGASQGQSIKYTCHTLSLYPRVSVPQENMNGVGLWHEWWQCICESSLCALTARLGWCQTALPGYVWTCPAPPWTFSSSASTPPPPCDGRRSVSVYVCVWQLDYTALCVMFLFKRNTGRWVYPSPTEVTMHLFRNTWQTPYDINKLKRFVESHFSSLSSSRICFSSRLSLRAGMWVGGKEWIKMCCNVCERERLQEGMF